MRKVIDTSRVSDRMIVVMLLVQRTIVSVILVYVPKSGLCDSQKDEFYDSLINVVRKSGEKEIVVTAEDFNSHHNGSNSENHEVQHEGYDYGIRNKEGERILEFCASMKMTVRNALFKKRTSYLVTYESGPS